MLNRTISSLLALCGSLALASAQPDPLKLPPIAEGPFKPDWNSLTNYQTPEWFRDAKFGIWAHWGPQCQPEHRSPCDYELVFPQNLLGRLDVHAQSK
jgi:alpha-L-fucosidase